MAVHRDFGVKYGFLGEMAVERDFWVKNVFFWPSEMILGKMAVQIDFWVKNGVLGENVHAKGFLG